MDPKETFYRQFQLRAGTLQDQITQLPSFSTAGGERQDAIEHVLVGISRLSQEVADAADFVPAYDQRGYAKAVKLLTEELEETKAKLAPKSRFQFKPRGGAKCSSGTDARRFVPSPNYLGRDDDNDIDIVTAAKDGGSTTPGQGSEQADNVGSLPTFTSGGVSKNYNEEISKCAGKMGPRKPSFSAARDITLSDHRRLHIILPQSASTATSAGQLTNLDGCIVDMSVPTAAAGGAGKPFASLALKNITNSLIVAGHVDGPAHITGVKNTVLVIVARQVRIHECENVDLYLHCASHPIIEDCQGMRFAPAPGYHTTEKEPPETNQWDQVDDFKWLKAEHSPNWSVLPEEERIPEEVWRDVVPGAPGLGLEDVLRRVGLPLKSPSSK